MVETNSDVRLDIGEFWEDTMEEIDNKYKEFYARKEEDIFTCEVKRVLETKKHVIRNNQTALYIRRFYKNIDTTIPFTKFILENAMNVDLIIKNRDEADLFADEISSIDIESLGNEAQRKKTFINILCALRKLFEKYIFIGKRNKQNMKFLIEIFRELKINDDGVFELFKKGIEKPPNINDEQYMTDTMELYYKSDLNKVGVPYSMHDLYRG